MLAIRRLLCISFVLSSLAVPLHAAVTGTVINIDGKAVTGAKVSLFAPELIAAQGPRLQSADPQRTPLATVTTDSGGKFTLDVPKDQIIVDVRVEAAGYAPSGNRYAADDEAGAILLAQAAPVRGTITANGKPVPNATVAIYSLTSEYTTKTDADGHYTAPDPSKWALRVIVLHPDYAVVDELIGPNGTKKGPNFSMTAGVAVTGRVVAEDGQTPAGDAQLLIDGWPAGKSAADGTFTIAHAKKEWDTIEARSGNSVALRARKATGSPTLKLAKGGIVSGNVRDIASQLPVAGARVAIAPAGGFGAREATHDTITDAKGNFTISQIVPGRYDIRSSRPGFGINTAQAIPVKGADSVQKTLYATARGRITGLVVNEDKQAVPAAHLAARPAARDDRFAFMPRMGGGGSDAYSAPDGQFVLRNVETEAKLQIDATKRGFPDAKSASIKLAPAERKTGVVLTIPRGIAVTGKVTDKDHKPLSGVGVEASESENDGRGGGGVRRVVMNLRGGGRTDEVIRTGSDGTFSIRVKEGTYDLSFKREGFSEKTVRGTKVDATTKPLEVALDPGVEITGRVTRSGAGVEGVDVRAMSQAGMAGGVTGADGSFTISDLTPGTMMLIVNKQDSFIQEMRSVTAPAKDVVIDLPAGGRITGHVIDKTSHQPVTSFMAGVTTSRGGGGMVMMMPPMQKQFTSDDGTFALEGIKPGSTQVVVNAPGYATARVPNIEVEDGKTAPEVEVDVETGAKLTGHVTGPDGSPVSGVSVALDPIAGGGRVMRFDSNNSTTATDPNGDYTLDSLEPGNSTFTFSRSGFIAQQKSVTLAGSTRLDVTLSSGINATGTVVSDGGTPISGAMVRAVSASEMDGGRQAGTDANGAFTIEGLTPGHYTFTATKAGYAPGVLRDVDIASSGPVHVTLLSGGVITGHINGLTAQELEQTTVSASVSGAGGGGFGGGPQGGGNLSAPADSGGNYRIEGAPSGTVRLTARTGGAFGGPSKSAAPVTVQLDAGGTAQADIVFKTDTVISGRILRNGVAMANVQVIFSPRAATSQTSASTSTDANGHYELSSLDDGTYAVQVLDMSRLSLFSTQHDVHGSDTFDITITTVTLHGRVIDATDSHPLNGATVDLRPAAGQPVGGGSSASTDANGGFTLENIAAGTYQLTADKAGYGHDARQLTIGTSAPDDVQFQLSASDGITIQAVDARDNTPLTVNVVRVVDSQGNVLPSQSGLFSSNETVKLALSPGVYTVTVMARNYASQTISMTSPSNQTVRFSPGGTIILHSKDSSTRRAQLLDAAGVVHGVNAFSQGIFSLPTGATPINNLLAGHYTLQILDNANRVTKTVQIDVIDGQQSDYDV